VDASDPNDVSAWGKILLDVAEPIMESSDIRQALEQSEADPETFREFIVTYSTDLICSRSNPELDFVERLVPLPFARHWRLMLAAGVVALAILGVFNVILCLYVSLFLSVCYVAWSLHMILFGIKRPLELEPIEATRHILEREVVGPFLRQQINQLLAGQQHSEMRVTSAPGLAQLSDREQIIASANLRELARLTQTMASGSIGLSGPRGVGKTTLLRYFCDSSLGTVADAGPDAIVNPKDLRIMISAPVEYNTRDFILHLFEKFCETVLQTSLSGGTRNAGSTAIGQRSAKPGLLTLGGLLAAAGVALIIYGLLIPKHLPRLTILDNYIIAAIALLAIGAMILWQQTGGRTLSGFFSRNKTDVKDEAREWLRRIRYLQTMTTGYSGTIHVPLSADLAATTTQQLAEIQLTLPELVDRYRDFALRVITSRSANISESNLKRAQEERKKVLRLRERLVAIVSTISTFLEKWPQPFSSLAKLATGRKRRLDYTVSLARSALQYLQQPGVSQPLPRIVIGIDEIDRMSAASAERFLNDIKAIFGIPQCLYLVSVSDEALAVFEQRILQGRSAFDSTFDEVLRARELDFGSCMQLLRRRIAGIPDVLIAFCQVMSGGLPRDLIRMARLVVETSASGEAEIAKLVMSIITKQIKILKRSLMWEISRADSKLPSEDIIKYLTQDGWPGSTMKSVLSAIENDLTDMGLTTGFKTALYLYATVGEIFGAELPDTIMSLRNYDTTDAACIDRLAYAQNMISVNEEAAWLMIDAFRAARGLGIVRSPLAPLS
jgi:hypothetical protein